MAFEFPGKKPVQRETLEAIALERHYSVQEVAEMWMDQAADHLINRLE
jgi:hypothetical protein